MDSLFSYGIHRWSNIIAQSSIREICYALNHINLFQSQKILIGSFTVDFIECVSLYKNHYLPCTDLYFKRISISMPCFWIKKQIEKKNQMATSCVLVIWLIVLTFFWIFLIDKLQDARNRKSASKATTVRCRTRSSP